MYEVHECLTQYYAELDPVKRLAVLDSLSDSDSDGIDIDFLRELYNDRSSDHDNRGRKNVDWWLWRCICLQQLYHKGGFFKRFRKSEVNAILRELRTEDTEHAAYLYHEYRNTAGRYLSTCRSSGYASRFMGFRQASEDEKVLRACSDIWEMSRGIAKSEGITEQMNVWCEAFRDELAEYDPVCREEYLRLDRQK